MPLTDVTQMPFSKLYPLLVNKAVKKGRTREEVDQVTAWLTGYTSEEIARLEQSDICYGTAVPADAHASRGRGTGAGNRISGLATPFRSSVRE